MYSNAVGFCKACPDCAIVTGIGRKCNPPLQPIIVDQVFQIVGIDIMELPKTNNGYQYVFKISCQSGHLCQKAGLQGPL